MQKKKKPVAIPLKKCKKIGLFVQKSVNLPSEPSYSAYAQKENRRDTSSMEEPVRP